MRRADFSRLGLVVAALAALALSGCGRYAAADSLLTELAREQLEIGIRARAELERRSGPDR